MTKRARPVGNRHGTRWRGKLPLPSHSHPLVRQFIGELNAQMTTIRECATRAGLGPKTVCDWRYRTNPNLANFDAALNVLGLELCIRPRREPTDGETHV